MSVFQNDLWSELENMEAFVLRGMILCSMHEACVEVGLILADVHMWGTRGMPVCMYRFIGGTMCWYI